MMPLATWLVFVAACAVLIATPGPNVLYLVSRTLAQGRTAGFVSLAGTSSGFLLHVLAAAFGLSALLAAVPYAYDTIRIAGGLYLAWLAWSTWRAPDAPASVAVKDAVSPGKLYRQGFMTALLNPKVAMFQLALFPQFVDPSRGSVLAQSLILGATQIAVALIGDMLFIYAASSMRRFFTGRPGWGRWSKRLLATVFGALAARLVLDSRH